MTPGEGLSATEETARDDNACPVEITVVKDAYPSGS